MRRLVGDFNGCPVEASNSNSVIYAQLPHYWIPHRFICVPWIHRIAPSDNCNAITDICISQAVYMVIFWLIIQNWCVLIIPLYNWLQMHTYSLTYERKCLAGRLEFSNQKSLQYSHNPSLTLSQCTLAGPVYTGMPLECHRWPSVHWDTTERPSEYLQGTLEHHWKNLVETAPHWNATGET